MWLSLARWTSALGRIRDVSRAGIRGCLWNLGEAAHSLQKAGLGWEMALLASLGARPPGSPSGDKKMYVLTKQAS